MEKKENDPILTLILFLGEKLAEQYAGSDTHQRFQELLDRARAEIERHHRRDDAPAGRDTGASPGLERPEVKTDEPAAPAQQAPRNP